MSEPMQKTEARPERSLVVSQGRPAYPVRALDAFGITAGDWRVLVDAVFPGAQTTAAVELALAYCRARKLDVFKRPCHIVPIWDKKKGATVESVWPGISELRTTAMRTGLHAGWEEAVFGENVTETFTGKVGSSNMTKTVTFPAWCQMTCYKLVQGQRVPFPGPKVLWLETYATMGASDVPNEMWASRPFGQIEKCAEAAALRRAFPEEIGGDYVPEEVGHRGSHGIGETAPEPVGVAVLDIVSEESRGARAEEDAAEPAQEPEPAAEASGAPGGRLSPEAAERVRKQATKRGVDLDAIVRDFGGVPLEEISMFTLTAQGLEEKLIDAILAQQRKASK